VIAKNTAQVSYLISYKKHKNSERQELLPNEIKEYGLRDGKSSYKSFEISIDGNIKSVFLKSVILNGTNYYYYKEKGLQMFFIEQDDLIEEIPQSEFNSAKKNKQ